MWKKAVVINVLIGLFIAGAAFQAFAEESATPQEVVDNVKAAAAFLAEKGEAGLAEFNDKNGRWVWKDTYVFVFDCTGKSKTGGGTQCLVGHIAPGMIGKDINTLKDDRGTNLGTLLCGGVAEHPEGGWVEYTWPRLVLGEKKFVRKISYMKRVPGQPLEVGAGVYNEDIKLEDLPN